MPFAARPRHTPWALIYSLETAPQSRINGQPIALKMSAVSAIGGAGTHRLLELGDHAGAEGAHQPAGQHRQGYPDAAEGRPLVGILGEGGLQRYKRDIEHGVDPCEGAVGQGRVQNFDPAGPVGVVCKEQNCNHNKGNRGRENPGRYLPILVRVRSARTPMIISLMASQIFAIQMIRDVATEAIPATSVQKMEKKLVNMALHMPSPNSPDPIANFFHQGHLIMVDCWEMCILEAVFSFLAIHTPT